MSNNPEKYGFHKHYNGTSAGHRQEAEQVLKDMKKDLCICEYPLIRMNENGEYCGICEKDL